MCVCVVDDGTCSDLQKSELCLASYVTVLRYVPYGTSKKIELLNFGRGKKMHSREVCRILGAAGRKNTVVPVVTPHHHSNNSLFNIPVVHARIAAIHNSIPLFEPIFLSYLYDSDLNLHYGSPNQY